jgi:hypothetical protein
MLATSLATTIVTAEDSGFLSDYSLLTTDDQSGFTRAYIAPGAVDRIAQFNQVMIDQPSIIISADSKYKGAKPNDILEVSEMLRTAMSEGVSESFPVVTEPGEGAALISWAVSNVYLKKAKRGLLGYTPVGAVAFGAKNMMSDVIDKTRASDVVFEIEATNSLTGEVFFAMIYELPQEKKEAEWGDALALANGIGKRIGCRLNNSRLAVDERTDCLAIPIAVTN